MIVLILVAALALCAAATLAGTQAIERANPPTGPRCATSARFATPAGST